MEKRVHYAQFLALLAVSAILWWYPLHSTLRLALTSEPFTHILLILPLAVAFIYMERKSLDAGFSRNVAGGICLLSLGLMLLAFSRGLNVPPVGARLSMSMFALVTWWIGSVLLCFGKRVFRSFLFPLLFLFWMVPIPDSPLNGVIEFLQYQSALASRMFFVIAGVPVTHDGVMLSIPGLDIEVAHECSSIRSSLMLVVTTMVLAQLFLRSRWRKALLIVAAIPLSIVKNGLRIFAIAELGTRVDPGFLDGNLHHHGGIVFFGLSVIAVAVLLLMLRRSELAPPVARSATV